MTGRARSPAALQRRAWLVALALVAIFFIGVRQVCEAAGTGGGALHVALGSVLGHAGPAAQGHDASTCCASVEDGALAKVSEPWAQLPAGGKLAALAILLFFTAVPALPRAAAAPLRPDPRRLSYYRRSARILR